NKGPVLAASLLLLALMVGSIGTTIGMVQARRSAEAERTAKENALEAKETAEAREAETNAVLEFVESKVFAAARPKKQHGGLGYQATLREAVESALPFVARSFPKQALIEARLRMTLGISFGYLGDAKIATEQFETARALFAKLGDDRGTLTSMNNLAVTYDDLLGRHTDALRLNEETLARRNAKLGPDHPDTLIS